LYLVFRVFLENSKRLIEFGLISSDYDYVGALLDELLAQTEPETFASTSDDDFGPIDDHRSDLVTGKVASNNDKEEEKG
jgi:hypothetical protein